jgi:hypothetical protein
VPWNVPGRRERLENLGAVAWSHNAAEGPFAGPFSSVKVISLDLRIRLGRVRQQIH